MWQPFAVTCELAYPATEPILVGQASIVRKRYKSLQTITNCYCKKWYRSSNVVRCGAVRVAQARLCRLAVDALAELTSLQPMRNIHDDPS